MHRTRRTRVAAVAIVVVVMVAVSASAALAHVTVRPDEAEKGSFEILSFSVPNERPETSTIGLTIQMPTDKAVPFVSVQPKPGWTVEVTKRRLDEPISGEDEDITEVVDTITWTGGQIAPGEFDLFLISAGPLPSNAKQLVFMAVQSYSDGVVVRWIESSPNNGEEPEHPAPPLMLVMAKENGGH
jgi:uncharacterized protein YcnI